ncbi:MAG: transposase, partial [Rhodothermaceae bacterium]|nr:transposase [Rhodothermaceae bacterium]MYJ21102.1 transposase [Rhodothermaceae bacterium]
MAKAFLEKRCDWLFDIPRLGKPRMVSDEDVEKVITKTLASMPRDAMQLEYTQDGRATGVSASTVNRIWRAFGVKPHRTETYKLSKDLEIHLVLDNYSTHKTDMIHNWLLRRPRVHLYSTPSSASRLNLVERWFAKITSDQIRGGMHRSTKELETAIKDYLEIYNEAPKPFNWTKSAEQILESLKTYCKRNNSGSSPLFGLLEARFSH